MLAAVKPTLLPLAGMGLATSTYGTGVDFVAVNLAFKLFSAQERGGVCGYLYLIKHGYSLSLVL